MKRLDESNRDFITALLPEVPALIGEQTSYSPMFVVSTAMSSLAGDHMYQGGVCWSPKERLQSPGRNRKCLCSILW